MPQTAFSIRIVLRRLPIACLVAAALSSCIATKKAEDGTASAESTAEETEGLKAPPAMAGKAASAGHSVDPMTTKAPGQHQASTAPPGALAPHAATAADTGFPPAPAQGSAAVGGLVTQPTGVRAGSFSIFSSGPAPQAAGAPSPGAGIGATKGSMFTPRQPLPPANCTTDANGLPVNC